MYRPRKPLLYSAIVIALTSSTTIVLLVARTRTLDGIAEKSIAARGPSTMPPEDRPRSRNLALHPVASQASRRLGKRFESNRRDVSVVVGTLLIGAERHAIQIVRRQSDRSERVEIALGGTTSLSWSEEEGFRSSGRDPNQTERVLIERLAFDSADQFVLAQLRGASYYTVARNVRPDLDGADTYRGSIWDVIRIDDPETDSVRRPLSNWRLYYLNVRTGLIDKIESEINGERFLANFSEWTEQGGERFPARVVWTRSGETILDFRLSTFAVTPHQ